MKEGIEKGKILFFDPNNTTNEKNTNNNTLVSIFGGKEIMKDPEDLSISVDLEVINKSRKRIVFGEGSTGTSIISGKKTNFLSGKKLGNTNVLSTYFTDIKYDDTDKETLSEALSIKSIDIEFNSWYVATVNINFVDIRGAALFSPSEHNQMNPDSYLKDSPYSAFFTMPYPQFNLKVKGVYGDAVSYPLHLLDFKASFNNSTGNFEISTNFIGYTYAILNDIQMTYLIAAPYLDLYGASYWEREVKRGRFLTLEGASLPKIPDMIENVIKGDYQLQKLTQTDSRLINNNQTKNKVNDVDTILNEVYNYTNIVRDNVKVINGSSDYSFSFEVRDSDNALVDNSNILNFRTKIIGLVEKYNDNYPNDSLFTSKYYTYEPELEGDKIDRVDLNKELLPKANKFNIKEFKNLLSNFKNTESENLIDLNEQANNIILDNLIGVYGFNPSIYNFTKTLLAHMETLLHVIGQTAKESARDSDRDFTTGGHETDLKDNKLDPFPWLTIDNKDAWFGDYTQYAHYSEVKLVDSFHRAKTSATSLIRNSLVQDMSEYDVDLDTSTEALIGDIWLPINAFDTSINILNGKKSPYSNFKDSLSSVKKVDVKSVLSSRITTIASLAPFIKLDDYALAESINILNQIGYSKEYIDIFIIALEETVGRIESLFDGSAKYPSIKDIHVHMEEFFYDEGFSFLRTSGQLPLNDKTINELKNSVEVNAKFNDSVNYYEEGSDDNVEIIDGKGNCELIHDNWYGRVKNLISSTGDLDMGRIMSDYKLSKDSLILSYSEQMNKDINVVGLPTKQPMLNRVGRSSTKSKRFFSNIKNDINDNVNSTINNVEFINNFHDGQSESNSQLFSLDLSLRNNINNGDITNIEKFTYPLVGGIIKNWRYGIGIDPYKEDDSKAFTLFGHPLYYKQGDHTDDNIGNLAKAYLFLQTLPIYTTEIEKYIVKDKSFMLRLPKATLLFLGAVQWRRKYMNDKKFTDENKKVHSLDPIIEEFNIKNISGAYIIPTRPNPNQTYRQNNIFTLNVKTKDRSIFGGVDSYDTCDIPLDSPFSAKLIKYFRDWCTTEDDNGWIKIKNVLEHRDDNDNLFGNLTQFNKYLDKIDINKISENDSAIYQSEEHQMIRANRAHTKYDSTYLTYQNISFKILNVIYKDGSDPVKAMLNLLSEEAIISHTGNYKIFDKDATTKTVDIGNLLIAVKTLANKIQSNLINHDVTKGVIEKNKDSIGESTYDKNREINLQTYKYLKSLYDKWVSGYEYDTDKSEYKWISTKQSKVGDYTTYDIKNFKFIDRSYNHIGQKFILNLKDVLSDIGMNEQKTLYTTITNVLSKNNFLFIAMPNYQPWNTASDFAKIFKPIPHHLSKINVGSDMYNAQFLCMYTGELAKRLDNNSEYKEDGLDLNIANDYVVIADDYSNEELTDGQLEPIEGQLESVPVFAVSYGKQNQQYFKNISLNQNNPATTEASVMAIQRLVERNDKTTSIELVTQDLYNIYSDYSYLCEVDMLGCAQIQPMMYFQLTNIPMWNGAYLIYKVKHSIQPGAMTTNFTGMKMGKRYPDFVTPKTITYGDLSNIYGGDEDQYIEISTDQKFGYFALGEYFKRNGKVPVSLGFPRTIVQRIKNVSSPIIDIIYETWVKDKGKPGFVVTSGYRSDSTTMHGQGLAVDIQIKNNGGDGKLHGELFAHIMYLMKNMEGFKIDQLISESENNGSATKYWVHVGVGKIVGNMISCRGQCATMINHKNFTVVDVIEKSKGEVKYIIPSSTGDKLLDEFITFWKKAENEIGKGWRSKEGKWYKYDDVGEPAIAYGLRIKTGMSNLNYKDELADGKRGITEGDAIEEVRYRIGEAIKLNNQEMIREFTEKEWDKVDERYKYVLVDIRLNVGNLSDFTKLKRAIIDNKEEDIKRECKTKDDVRRNKLKIDFINGSFA